MIDGPLTLEGLGHPVSRDRGLCFCDRVEGEKSSSTEGGRRDPVSFLLRHVGRRDTEVVHDVDNRTHRASGLVEDFDASLRHLLLGVLVRAEPPDGFAESGRSRRRVDVPVAKQTHRQQDVVEVSSELGAERCCLRQSDSEVPGLKVGQLRDAQEFVSDLPGIVSRHRVRVQRADDRLSSLTDTDLSHRTRREVEHRNEGLDRLLRCLTSRGKVHQTLHGLIGRKFSLDACLRRGLRE